MKTLTVFTPTYNRKHTLPRTYESLCRQSCRDFDWLVIDDGSSDGTREWILSLGELIQLSEVEASLVEGGLKKFDWMGRIVESEDLPQSDHFFIQTPHLRIEYVYKPNGGLYTGYNVAYQTIKTELCVCIDSDDFMPDDAVNLIVEKWKKLSAVEKGKYCGIVGLDFDVRTKEPIGGHFNVGTDEVFALGLSHIGDVKYVLRTELMYQVAPQIGFEGERDFNPHYMQMQVLDQYPILLLNENLCWVEYQIGGDSMSQGIFKQYVRSPRSYAKMRLMEMQMKHGMTPNRLWSRHALYVSSCIFSKDKLWLRNSPNKFKTLLMAPVGVLLSCYIKYKESH